ncbi:hypothetical protein BDV09DRAFT_163191 [Aspergillus tetrazonus]
MAKSNAVVWPTCIPVSVNSAVSPSAPRVENPNSISSSEYNCNSSSYNFRYT